MYFTAVTAEIANQEIANDFKAKTKA